MKPTETGMTNNRQAVAVACKLILLVKKHPGANIKFKARSPLSYCGCLMTTDCIEYNTEQDTIYIG